MAEANAITSTPKKSQTLPPNTHLSPVLGSSGNSSGFMTKIKRILRINSKGKYDLSASEYQGKYKKKKDDVPTDFVRNHPTLRSSSVRVSSRDSRADKEEVVISRNGKVILQESLRNRGEAACSSKSGVVEIEDCFEEPGYESLDEIRRKVQTHEEQASKSSLPKRSQSEKITSKDLVAERQAKISMLNKNCLKGDQGPDESSRDSGLGSPRIDGQSRERHAHSATSSLFSDTAMIIGEITIDIGEEKATSSLLRPNSCPWEKSSANTNDKENRHHSELTLSNSRPGEVEESLYANSSILFRKKSQYKSDKSVSSAEQKHPDSHLSVEGQQEQNSNFQQITSKCASENNLSNQNLSLARNMPPPLPLRQYTKSEINKSANKTTLSTELCVPNRYSDPITYPNRLSNPIDNGSKFDSLPCQPGFSIYEDIDSAKQKQRESSCTAGAASSDVKKPVLLSSPEDISEQMSVTSPPLKPRDKCCIPKKCKFIQLSSLSHSSEKLAMATLKSEDEFSEPPDENYEIKGKASNGVAFDSNSSNPTNTKSENQSTSAGTVKQKILPSLTQTNGCDVVIQRDKASSAHVPLRHHDLSKEDFTDVNSSKPSTKVISKLDISGNSEPVHTKLEGDNLEFPKNHKAKLRCSNEVVVVPLSCFSPSDLVDKYQLKTGAEVEGAHALHTPPSSESDDKPFPPIPSEILLGSGETMAQAPFIDEENSNQKASSSNARPVSNSHIEVHRSNYAPVEDGSRCGRPAPRPPKSSRRQRKEETIHMSWSELQNQMRAKTDSFAADSGEDADESSSADTEISSVMTESTENKHLDFLENMRQLRDCGWYWGPLSYEEAEAKLKHKPDGSFLVRDSSNENYILSLSFTCNGVVHHTRIEHHKGMFSFWSQPVSHGKDTIREFIEQAVINSKNGTFHYFLRPSGPGTPPLPIRLVHPISRFYKLGSLQHMCRFLILRWVRRDHIDNLPLPEKVKNYLRENQYYVETLDDD